SCRRAREPRDAQCARALERFSRKQKPEVASSHLDRPLGLPGGFVATKELFRAIARIAFAIQARDVVPAVLILGNAKVDVEPVLVGGKRTLERLRRRTRLRLRHVEEQTVGQDAGRGRQREASGRQRLSIDLELPEPPRAKGEGGELKLEEVLEESVLGL